MLHWLLHQMGWTQRYAKFTQKNSTRYSVASCWIFRCELYYDARIHEHQVMHNYPSLPFRKFHYLSLWGQRTVFLFILNKHLIYNFDASLSIINYLGTSKCSYRRNGSKSGIFQHSILSHNVWHNILNTLYKKLINYTHKNIIFALFAGGHRKIWYVEKKAA
jgi:hypothetical protein